jgi:hypothetical protein
MNEGRRRKEGRIRKERRIRKEVRKLASKQGREVSTGKATLVRYLVSPIGLRPRFHCDYTKGREAQKKTKVSSRLIKMAG